MKILKVMLAISATLLIGAPMPAIADTQYKIMVIIPVVTTQYNAGIMEEISPVIAPDFTLHYKNLPTGTNSIESRYDEYLDTSSIIALAVQAEKDGYDAIFITCFGEPAVSTVRELVDIPVVGGFLAPSATANLLSQRYSIVTVLDSVLAMIRDLARDLGTEVNLQSNQQIDIPVEDLGNLAKVEEALLTQSIRAVREYGSLSVLLGCTGMTGVKSYVQTSIFNATGLRIPVVSPNQQAVAFLQNMVRTGLTQSRLTYFPQQVSAEPSEPRPFLPF